VVTVDEVQQFLRLGHEIRSFEVKGPGSLSDKGYCAKVARAAMAMGNLRDGGLVCLGIAETRMADMLPGLDPTQLIEWANYDDVTDALARYADPPVAFRPHRLTLASRREVVVIEVSEFEDVPHVCKRDYPEILQNGMTYVRPRGKPESVPVPSSTEMRELLDLAITKGVREFIRRAGAAGVQFGAVPTVEDVEREAFANEAKRAWAGSTSVMDQILSSGHTDVAIRPGPYDLNRVSPERLEPLVLENAVRLKGWPVPFFDQLNRPIRHGSWIGQDIEPRGVPHCEAWRMCTSGQFLQRRILATDLRESAQPSPNAPGATVAVAVQDVLSYLVEVAELGARLATTLECETITIAASLVRIGGRQLISGNWNRDLDHTYIVNADRLDASEVIASTRLIEDPRGAGVKITQRLLRQFGLDISEQVLLDWQEKVFDRR
jgi:hypothetical protein